MESNTNLELIHNAITERVAEREKSLGCKAVKLSGSELIRLDFEITHEAPLHDPADYKANSSQSVPA